MRRTVARIYEDTNVGDTSSGGGHITGSINNKKTVKVEGFHIAIITDKVSSHDDHGDNTIDGGSETVRAYGFKVARTGDSVSCGHTVISAALKTFAD